MFRFTNDELEALMQSASYEERSAIPFSDLDSITITLIERIEDDINKELKLITIAGMKRCDFYKTANRLIRDADSREVWHIDTRVRLLRNSFSADWYRNSFSKDPSPDTGKHKVYSTHITRGKNNPTLPMYKFKKVTDNEREAIVEVESHYKVLRQRFFELSKIKRSIKMYKKYIQAE